MKIKLVAGVLGAALAIGVPIFAQAAADQSQANSTTQAAPYGHHRGGDRMQKLKQELNLTADQQAKLQPIFEQTHTQSKAIRQDSSLSSDQKRAKMKELHESAMAQMNGILTPEQQTQWKQLQEQRRQEWKKHKEQMQKPQATPPSTAPQQ